MELSGEKTFSPRMLSHQYLHSTELDSTGIEVSTKVMDVGDAIEKDQSRAINLFDSSWSSCGISTVHSLYEPNFGACRSLHPTFSETGDSGQKSVKSQSFQEQYWACAIPNTLPPCPDRSSPHWDPNKEYQDLLDYTYPLNPKYFVKKNSDERETDAYLHDSGVDLDSYNISYGSKLGSVSSTSQEEQNVKTDRYTLNNNLSSPYAFSTPLPKRSGYRGLKNLSESSKATSCGEFIPRSSQVNIARDSKTTLSVSKYNVFDRLYNAHESSGESLAKSGHFLATTRVLPLQTDLDSDEEYLSLPPSLKELEKLATQIKDLSLSVGQSGNSNGRQTKECKQNCHMFGNDKDQRFGVTTKNQSPDVERKTPRDLNSSRNSSDSEINSFSYLREMLGGRTSSQFIDLTGCPFIEKSQENKSLVQRIQNFCHHLDKLIQWLYSVAAITDNWSAPKPNVESIQLSLSLYLKLKKDIAEQRTLADTIMKDGESLVKCMALNSSVLKDTLAFISKQSGELERHTENLYASVLEAMDTITEESLGRNGNLKQHVSLEMESS